jgi:hypothetical protein
MHKLGVLSRMIPVGAPALLVLRDLYHIYTVTSTR